MPDQFVVWVVELSPGAARRVDPAEWGDALVVVERGRVEIEAPSGARQTFGRGAVLWLAGMPIIMRNSGHETALVAAVRRRNLGKPEDVRPGGAPPVP